MSSLLRHTVSLAMLAALFTLAGCVATNKNTATVTHARPADESRAIASADKQSTVTIELDAGTKVRPGTQFAIYDAADTDAAERKAVISVIKIDGAKATCRVNIQYEPIKPGDWGFQLQQSIDGHFHNAHILGPELHPPIEQGHDPTE